ncbi:MAG: hypothetical protein COZ37_02295 [bacterium (Candidatus Ratteibacteria) CG_4_10_14_3_um_filter_41_18]|uniref:DNA polymerase III subunit delta n=4 Tax=Candidatus Ratteibacteria TaxID=2979319 RepID=A0A2M7YGI3_9BACT|nr:MAG: hypothetical protein AUJ76_04620 [Candidatus Omnitrophica bacterium CG1_02_41_171]PIV64554.1 MAG: hypothetical protein COS11_01590 [bacterium (Candidatus Ratteibacteria) CG01_land_8_20_14_3_00_40_19]PIW33083.1 MAG: hypothetical protein COW28_04615 [bacterium (Candidatus Ratteibacteria) CG15_BIG_FIL_POST_REV_8_21_14_020_41_12]PIW74362.1 MAG: hypothetical protein CO004_01130 [bacterium (Candidatus Ratteibacteria) CG_4_8_14_3_um_filter_41_36]PIX77510.1 MAG: hypothetical protein COZ37_02295
MTYSQLLNAIAKGELEPFYIIQATDDFLIKEALKRVKNALSTKENAFNYHNFSGTNTTTSTILNLAKTLPFSSAKRLIVVEDVEKIKISERKKVFSYLSEPASFTSLFLFIKGKINESFPSANLIRLKKGDINQIAGETNPFDLTFWLGKKNLSKAFEALVPLLLKERDFPRILGMLAWWLRQKSKLKGEIDQELLRKFNQLRATELAIKGGKFSPRLGLELLLIKLTKGG